MGQNGERNPLQNVQPRACVQWVDVHHTIPGSFQLKSAWIHAGVRFVLAQRHKVHFRKRIFHPCGSYLHAVGVERTHL